MTSRKHKLVALAGIAAAAALTFGAVGAHSALASSSAPKATDSDDSYNPANTHVNGHSNSTVFTVGAITVTCYSSDAGGTTPSSGIKPFALNPLPTFTGSSPTMTTGPCTDTVGATDTTTTNNTNGKWTIGVKDAKSDEATTEPNAGDKLTVTVPKAGAIVNNSFGCVITVAPNGPFKVTGTYDDVNTFKINISNLPIVVTGPAGVCPLSATTSTFKATYIFSPGVSDAS